MRKLVRLSLFACVKVAILTAFGCSPSLRATDDTLDFGDTFVGTPVTRSVAWTNESGTDAQIREVEVGSDGRVFAVDASDLREDPEVSENERSRDVSVRFNPDEVGIYESELVADVRRGKAETVRLRGRGVYALTNDAVSLSGEGLRWDRPLDHGSVPVDGGEAVRRLTVTNRTNNTVLVKPSFSRGGHGFSIRNGIDAVRLEPGEDAELVTVFRPKATGTASDTLLLTVDDTDARGGVVVTGRGERD